MDSPDTGINDEADHKLQKKIRRLNLELYDAIHELRNFEVFASKVVKPYLKTLGMAACKFERKTPEQIFAPLEPSIRQAGKEAVNIKNQLEALGVTDLEFKRMVLMIEFEHVKQGMVEIAHGSRDIEMRVKAFERINRKLKKPTYDQELDWIRWKKNLLYAMATEVKTDLEDLGATGREFKKIVREGDIKYMDDLTTNLENIAAEAKRRMNALGVTRRDLEKMISKQKLDGTKWKTDSLDAVTARINDVIDTLRAEE